MLAATWSHTAACKPPADQSSVGASHALSQPTAGESRPSHPVLSECVLERVSVFAMEQIHPPGLFSEVLQNRIVLLGQDPDTLFCMSAAKGQLI